MYVDVINYYLMHWVFCVRFWQFLCFTVQEEQLYTWATVGLPVSTNLWELYGGQKTGKERSLRTGPRQPAARAPPTQVGCILMYLAVFIFWFMCLFVCFCRGTLGKKQTNDHHFYIKL